MGKLIFLIPLFVMTMGMAYAEPLGGIQTTILNHTDNSATVEITWDNNDGVSSYTIGCVSCFPHVVESTTSNSIVLNNVTSFPNSPLAMLYGIAYDLENDIIYAKQIFIDLTQ